MLATLAEVCLQQSVVIESVANGRLESQRLMDLGFVPGTVVQRVGQGPYGGPLVVEVRNARLAIRREDAKQILVRTECSRGPSR